MRHLKQPWIPAGTILTRETATAEKCSQCRRPFWTGTEGVKTETGRWCDNCWRTAGKMGARR